MGRGGTGRADGGDGPPSTCGCSGGGPGIYEQLVSPSSWVSSWNSVPRSLNFYSSF